MPDIRITHIGGPTALIEVDGWRLLTDPTFDPPGQRYYFGWGTGSRKLAGPAIAASDLLPIDGSRATPYSTTGCEMSPACRSTPRSCT